jgi:hypothetical protein
MKLGRLALDIVNSIPAYNLDVNVPYESQDPGSIAVTICPDCPLMRPTHRGAGAANRLVSSERTILAVHLKLMLERSTATGLGSSC